MEKVRAEKTELCRICNSTLFKLDDDKYICPDCGAEIERYYYDGRAYYSYSPVIKKHIRQSEIA